MGGALCRPLRRRRCRDQGRKPWRERPRCARSQWPRACPEGSLTPWLSLSLSGCRRRQVRRREAPRVCCIDRARLRPRSVRTIWSRSSGKCWPQTGRVHARLPGQFCPGNRGFKRGAFDVGLRRRGSDRHSESRRRVGHHGDDAASVLGTVQGSALRSARACARPSGLDGACAQMIRGQLRDGRRMLLPSGTHDASMDPLDGTRGALACVRSLPDACDSARLLRFIFHDFDR